MLPVIITADGIAGHGLIYQNAVLPQMMGP
jgi:hypothetical protein